jgi:hypothetical protein
LIRFNAPDKARYNKINDYDRNWNQYKNYFHLFTSNLLEFKTTNIELTDMPKAAIQGLIMPDAANGITEKLYVIAHPIFCLIVLFTRFEK